MSKQRISTGGRPSKYIPEYATEVEKLARLGATDKDIADFFNIHEDTVNEWKKVHPEFSESLKRGKLLADVQVADRLFTRATGYKYTEVTKEKSPKGNELIVTKEVVKEVPPDPASIIFWLKNRRKDLWRDKQDHSFELNNDIVVRRPKDEEGDNG